MPRFRPTVELAPGADITAAPSTWSWTDLTMLRYVHEPAGIQITRGRQDRYAQTSPAQCSLTLLNPSGIWVPDNPTGQYYGLIDQNTPIRVLIRSNTNSASDVFNRSASSSWGSADVGGAWTNTGGAASDFSVAAASGGRHLHTSATSPHYSTLAFSLIRSDVTVRVRVNALSTGAAQTAGITSRYVDSSNLWRAELQFATSGAITARLVIRASGTDTPFSSTPTTLTHSASTWYRMRLQTGVGTGRFKVWLDGTTEPATWLIDGSASAFGNGYPAGAVGVYSIRETSNTNSNATIDFDDFSMVDGAVPRFTGFVDSWPTTWADESERQSFAPITASGRLRIIGQAQNLKSAIYRASTAEQWSGAPLAKGYWPMEDASGATVFASGLSGGLPMTFSDMNPAADSTIPGSDPLPTGGSGAYFTASIPTYTATSEWAVRAVMKFPALPSVNTAVLAWTTSGTIDKWALVLTTGSTWTIQGYTNGTEVLGASFQNFIDLDGGSLLGRQIYLEADAAESGGTIGYSVYLWSDNATFGALTVGGSIAGTLGIVNKIFHSAYPGLTAGGYTIGHVGVADAVSWAANAYLLATGFGGELSSDRLARLGNEENLAVYFGELLGAGTGSTEQVMGPQRTMSLIQQLREVEATEEGILYDGLQGQVTLLPRSQRRNHAVNLTIDHDAGQIAGPFTPIRDDFLLRNDIKVSNASGATAPASDVDGIRRWGVYSESLQISARSDTEVADHAQWRLNLGKTPALRYPAIELDLHNPRNAALIDSWLACDIGSRLNIANLPNSYDTADLLLEGYEETFDSSSWTVRLNTSPAQPWDVFVLDDASLGRLDTDGSTLVNAVPAGPLNSSTFESGVSGWTPTSATFVQSSTHAHAGTYAGLLTVTGSPAQAYVRAEVAVTVGRSYYAEVWCYSVAGYGAAQASIDWYDSGHGYLSTTAGSSSALAAATWEKRTVTGTAPASAAYGQFGPTLTGSPPTSTAIWVDDAVMDTQLSVATPSGVLWTTTDVPFDIGIAGERITVTAVTGSSSPQTFTVTRAVNGVAKAQAASATVSLWKPGVLAL